MPPPCVIVDQITGEGRILSGAEMIPCSYEECFNLEPAVVWGRVDVVRRLLGENIFIPTMIPRPPSMTIQEWQHLFQEWQQRCNDRRYRSDIPQMCSSHVSSYLVKPRVSKNTAEEYAEEINQIKYEIELAEQEKSIYRENAIDPYLKRKRLMRCLYAAGYGFDVRRTQYAFGFLSSGLETWRTIWQSS